LEVTVTATDVLESLVEECRVDHVGLWEIVNAARHDLGASSPAEVQTTTVQLVRSLLDRGMHVGYPAPDGKGFVLWGLPAEGAVRRIEQEWSALGRDPNIGEVAWFTAP
jgi:hypothetical protein